MFSIILAIISNFFVSAAATVLLTLIKTSAGKVAHWLMAEGLKALIMALLERM